MGTNFYLRANPKCEHCGRGPERGLHIGKSSGGWTFGLRIYPPEQHWQVRDFDKDIASLTTLDEWLPLIAKHGVLDEYGRDVSYDDMIACITKRSHPNGLLRREHPMLKAEPGEGTYDLVPVEFS